MVARRCVCGHGRAGYTSFVSTTVDAPLLAGRWQDTVGAIGRAVGVPVTIALVALTAAGIAVGRFITSDAGAGIDRFDLRVAQQLADGRTSGMNALTGASTFLADSLTVAILWIAAMAFAAWRTRSWRIPVFVLAAIGGEKLTYLFTSMAVGRPRPTVPSLGHVYATNSFPSGHVGSAIVLYGGLVLALLWHDRAARGRVRPLPVRVGAVLVATAITVLVGFARMYRGHHYASDIAWGVFLGLAWLAIAWRTALRPADDTDRTVG